jgi:phage terminase small subunit
MPPFFIAEKERYEMTLKQYQNDITKKMIALNLHKPEFEHAIKAFARTLTDYEKTLDLFDKSGGQIMIKYTNKGGATNATKNPFYLALETLRQDILAYSRELGLTPAALKKINDTEMKRGKPSLLSETLRMVNRE